MAVSSMVPPKTKGVTDYVLPQGFLLKFNLAGSFYFVICLSHLFAFGAEPLKAGKL